MDAPIAYGFHSGLPWAASAGLLQNGDKAGPIACKSRIRGKPSCPLSEAAVTWREETRSAGRAKRSLEVIACTARLNDLRIHGKKNPGL
jgi:hypothetical protein